MNRLEYCASETQAVYYNITEVRDRNPTSITRAPTIHNAWPDKLFTLLTKKDQDFEKESKKIHWPPLKADVLLDVNINDNTWHKKILAAASSKYSFESLIGMPACIETDDFSIKYTQGIDDAVLPINQMGGSSYILIKPTHSSYEDLFFDCANPAGADKLTLEEYVKRQRAIIQAYDLQNNLLLKHITVMFNMLYRNDRGAFDLLKYGLYTESKTSINRLIDAVATTEPDMIKSVAKNAASLACMFPEAPEPGTHDEFANVIRLPSFEKFLETKI